LLRIIRKNPLIMLLQFSVRNFRTFKDKASLSLIASNYDKETRAHDNIAEDTTYNFRILRSAVIYGSNASGKSKFLEALMFMRHFAITSSKETQKGDKIPVESFKFSVETENDASEFEVIFIHKNTLYRYGFEVNKKHVVSEWLYHKPKTKEIELFYRDFQKFETHPKNFSKGTTIVKEGLVRNNALLLSVAAQFNDNISENVITWFNSLKTISGLREEEYQGYTMNRTQDSQYKDKILDLLKFADIGIHDIKLKMLNIDQLPKDMPDELKQLLTKIARENDTEIFSDILTSHKKFDGSKKYVGDTILSLIDDESSGTRKFFALTGLILDSIENGHTLIVDELDAKLHPNLVCEIVALFNSGKSNANNAQLIFNTHDTNLLSSGLFRRDQIWFTEKDKFGAAKLYSMADFKSDEVRKNEAFEENYLRGKYGAVPFLTHFDELTLQKPIPAK